MNERRLVALALIVFLLAGAAVGWAAISQNTISHGRGAALPSFNATHYGYYVGGTQVIDNSRAFTGTTLDTGQGANELYAMDQNVLTSSDVNFSSVEADNLIVRGNYNVTQLALYPQQSASYIIWRDGSTYYAKNGTTGAIEFSGAVAATVIQAALDATEGMVFLRDGLYLTNESLTISNPLSFVGASMSNTIIRMTDQTKPILKLNRESIVLRNLHLEYNSQPDNSKTDATAIEVIGSSPWMTWENILIRQVYGGVRSDKDVYADASLFNIYVQNLRIRMFTGIAISADSTAGISGGSWNQVYINNAALLPTQCVSAIEWRGGSTTVWNQLNIEHSDFTSTPIFIVSNNQMVFNGLHMELITYDPQVATEGLIHCSEETHLVINGLDISNLASSNLTTKLALFKFSTANPATAQSMVVLNGLTIRNVDDMLMGEWNLVRAHNANVDAQYGAKLYLKGGYVDKAFDRDQSNYTGTGRLVKQNDTWVYENSSSAVIANGTASIVVAHGLAGTPIYITVTGTHSEVESCYVNTVGAANFTIHKGGAGNVTADRTVYWEAIYEP